MCAHQLDQRGILTDADIDFLKGTATPNTAPQQSRARKRIRERVAAALYDFETLRNHWSPAEQRQTLNLISETDEQSVEELGAELIAFLYTFLNYDNTRPDLVSDTDPVENLLRFRAALTRGIRKGKLTFTTSQNVVSIATTTPLYETPAPDKIRTEVSSHVLTDAHRKLNQKYRRSSLYEDDELIIDNLDGAIEDLFIEWYQVVTSTVLQRRLKADDFLRPPGTVVGNTRGYRDAYTKNPDTETK